MRLFKAWYNKIFHKAQIRAILKEANFNQKNGEYKGRVIFEDQNFHFVVSKFVQVFQDAGAINYLDFSAFDESTMQIFTVSIQRQRGRKVAEINRYLKTALVQILGLNRMHTEEYEIANHVLYECGYLKEDGTVV